MKANGTEAKPATRPQKSVGFHALVGTLGTGFFIKACGIIISIALARILGPAGRGSLETVMFWPVFLASVGAFGIDMVIKRLAAKEHDLAPVARAAFCLSLVLSAITVVIGYILLPFLLPHSQHHLLPLAILFLAFIPANHFALNLRAVDEGAGNFRRYNLIRSVFNPVWLLAILVIWLAGLATVKWFIVTLLIANFAVAAVRAVTAVRSFGITGSVHSPLAILREGFSFWLAGICHLSYERADKVLIIWLLGPRALGLYMVALAGSGLLKSSVGDSANTVVFAMAAQSTDSTGFDRTSKVFRGSALMWLLAGGCLAILIPVLLPVIYGSRFSEAILPGIVLIAGSALAMQARLLDSCLRGQGRPLAVMKAKLAAMITLIILAILAHRQWELLGVAFAFVVAQTVYLGVLIAKVTTLYGSRAPLKLIPTYHDIKEALARVKDYFRSLQHKVHSASTFE